MLIPQSGRLGIGGEKCSAHLFTIFAGFLIFPCESHGMEQPPINPVNWRLSTLLSLEVDQVHDLACWAVGTLTSFRLVLGRCLLALHQNKGYRRFGCSTAVHYACSVLGIDKRMARECKRVATQIRDLPELTLAAEGGEICWSKLREIVRKADPLTEDYWLKLADLYDANTIGELIARTVKGSIPGEPDEEEKCLASELRCAATPQVIQMFQRVRRILSLEHEEALNGSQTLEYLLASFLSTQPVDPETMRKVEEEADKDLQAEAAQRILTVIKARELAAEMGLLNSGPGRSEDSDALGTGGGIERPEVLEELEVPAKREVAVKLEASEELGGFEVAGVQGALNAPCCDEHSTAAVDLIARALGVMSGPEQSIRPGTALHSTSNSHSTSASNSNSDSHSHPASNSHPHGHSEAERPTWVIPPELPVTKTACNAPAAKASSEDPAAKASCEAPAAKSACEDPVAQALSELVIQLEKDYRNERLAFSAGQRFTTPGQKEEIFRRDGWCCSTPACPNRVWLHVHHIKPFSQGGPTTRRNLLSLCSGCHRNHHRGLLKIQYENGKLVFRDQKGRRLDHQADLALAGWLDRWDGWRGGEGNSHLARFYRGQWAVYS